MGIDLTFISITIGILLESMGINEIFKILFEAITIILLGQIIIKCYFYEKTKKTRYMYDSIIFECRCYCEPMISSLHRMFNAKYNEPEKPLTTIINHDFNIYIQFLKILDHKDLRSYDRYCMLVLRNRINEAKKAIDNISKCKNKKVLKVIRKAINKTGELKDFIQTNYPEKE